MPKQIIIANPLKLNGAINQIKKAGPDKMHVLADFDRTLTKAFVGGRRVPSLISVLRDHHYLTPDYPAQAKQLYRQYHAIEISHQFSPSQKKKAMLEWWTKHFALLIKSGLSKKDIKKAMSSGHVKLRPGAVQFIKQLHKHKIPLIIMSSSGLGRDSVADYLTSHKLLLKNIFIISNVFRWNERGRAISVKQPIIHSFNKDETVVKKFPIYKKIRNRTNVVLLGDNLHDVEMVTGFSCNNLLKIGFLNENIRHNLPEYKNNFDIIITHDGSFRYVNRVLKKLVVT
jgi:5'-nucleotidase